MNVSQPLVQASLVGEAIDQGPVLVFVADEEMNYVAVNQRACDVLGYAREELLALKLTDVKTDPRAIAEFAEFVASGKRSGTAHLRHRDGTDVRFDYSATITTVAGMTLYVAVGLVPDEPAGTLA